MNELFADWPGGVSDYREWLCVSDKSNVQRDGKVDTEMHRHTHCGSMGLYELFMRLQFHGKHTQRSDFQSQFKYF